MNTLIRYCFLSFMILSTFEAYAATSIKVLRVSGAAREVKGSVQRQLQIGDSVHEGYWLSLDPGALLFVSLDKDVVTKIAGPARARIKRVRGKDWELEMDRGVSASAIQNPEHRKEHFRLRTRAAVMGVRGTVFYTEARLNEPLFVCTCEGTVEFRDRDGKHLETVKATHHDRPLQFKQLDGSSTLRVSDAPMGNSHSDEDVKVLRTMLSEIQ